MTYDTDPISQSRETDVSTTSVCTKLREFIQHRVFIGNLRQGVLLTVAQQQPDSLHWRPHTPSLAVPRQFFKLECEPAYG